MAKVKSKVSINGTKFDAVLDDSYGMTNDIPEYPVETGFSISDSIIHKPRTLNLTVFASDVKGGAGGMGRSEAISKLESLYFLNDTVSVVTIFGSFPTMGIASIEVSRSSDTAFTVQAALSLIEVRKVGSKTTTIPDSYGKSGTSGTNAGTASTSTSATPAASSGGSSASASTSGGSSTPASGQSLAYSLAQGAGLL
jgi:hypothetical protein